jgi:glyoxylase-like metal-dependent hydrolase (beta-lactamase superfamily II)
MMKVHHLNCGTCCPWGGHLFDGTSHGLVRGHVVCHCLLIETDTAGLVLVDTGFGTRDIARRGRIAPFFRFLNQPQFREEETAAAQSGAWSRPGRGAPHPDHPLDFDHAGGLEDFPNARVHLLAREKEVADERRGGTFVGTRRYRPGPVGRGQRLGALPLGARRAVDGLRGGSRPRRAPARDPAGPARRSHLGP